jgi:hypothetical protein
MQYPCMPLGKLEYINHKNYIKNINPYELLPSMYK